ncbi:transcriptional regulator [Catellatospora sp. IY07-71]|uniref:helix-turn-helix domain-containing protein n=1 Tax=Catellatospora sp. IY07-71 TaxID=2728827 RepID=UPI001BB43C6D|nr:helix-turn-helix transcriptional regulator [Catellatospora sp. IY07-71]BCJ76182.1 transcriptional regulator [Catellatospora sp. IY07-71]
MPPYSSSATQALEVLGTRLREIRVDAGLTGRGLAALAGWHSSKVSKIEHAKQAPTPDDIKAWCQHCGAPAEAPELIASLRAVEGMFVDWRRMERTGLKLAQESVNPLWERTRRFRIYSGWLIPGPIQTGGYISALLTSIMARRDLPDDIEAATQVRIERQHVVRQPHRKFAIILEESVLRFRIGGVDTMAAQLGHLLTISTLPTVSVGVIPLDANRSAIWPTEGFFIYDDEQVAVELVSGYLTITQPREVAMYADTFSMFSKQAVHGAAARQLIATAINALDS